MSNDESTIPFPLGMLRAETLRSVAKDLGVIPGGKKEELLHRLRASSASGWVTPSKRKSEAEIPVTPSASAKKPRTPRTVPSKATEKPSPNRPSLRSAPRSKKATVTPKSPTRKNRRPAKGAPKAAPEPSPTPSLAPEDPIAENAPQQDASIPEQPKTKVAEGDSKPMSRAFDDYLVSGSTNVFLTADDLLAMVGGLPTPAPLTLWKSTTVFSQRDRTPIERVEHWLVPANEADKIQNTTAFQEAYKDTLEKEGHLKAARLKGEEGNLNEKKEPDAEGSVEPEKTWWYAVSVSRNLSRGALAVKLIKGTVEDRRVVPSKDAVEEQGCFWLSGLAPASQDESDSLDHVVELLF
ncbi:hypothetical protein K439DRAFT_1663549 [Ramaria rubella]|nr:hypothetical protein K439DRAFT_1663549 [Ramaria rubella]